MAAIFGSIFKSRSFSDVMQSEVLISQIKKASELSDAYNLAVTFHHLEPWAKDAIQKTKQIIEASQKSLGNTRLPAQEAWQI